LGYPTPLSDGQRQLPDISHPARLVVSPMSDVFGSVGVVLIEHRLK
jgi:hypothetical protein